MAIGGQESDFNAGTKRDQNKAGSTSSIEPLSAKVSPIAVL